ncbi:phytanoyl-CoA dioxygenase family protein [Terriglobus tenax]|uniref:phytanoyl-CoA dioxygenase family protein n=1 Tax=Terriglobus tenax TaxID=1111115 RepID=UPI0021E03048|nr:phytanoyl-CoA dioxygenase family protein [Terriglobus tenax]
MHFSEQVREHGFAIVEDVLSPFQVDSLLAAVSSGAVPDALRGGVRNLMELVPEVRTLAASETLRALVAPVLGENFFVVRAILFDKTPDANWKVPWHQDVTIAVKERLECEGYGPWSTKADVLHVQPPADVLEKMISVRLHLDPCPSENGALKVIPGSHQHGKLNVAQMERFVEQDSFVCEVRLGGALLMRPLLLHASSPSTLPGHRRVIHLDFAAVSLPCNMEWFEQTDNPSLASL